MLKAIQRWEYGIPIAASLMMIAYSIVVSPQRDFWNDEVFSWFFLADPSFSHMLAAFHDKLNNTPLLYFALGWGWGQLFGSGELSLRLFSCLGFCVAFGLTWILLRRNFGTWPAAVGVLSAFFTSQIVLQQIREARMYGLFMTVVAAGILLYDATGRRPRAGGWLVFGTFLVHAALIHTHLFGLFYSAALLFAMGVRDAVRKQWQPSLYGAALAGLATFIFYYPAFVVQADAGVPRSWIPLPSIWDLKSYLLLQNKSFMSPAIFNVVAVWLVLQYWVFKNMEREVVSSPEKGERRFSLRLICAILLAIPPAIWVLSYLIRPLYWDRYLAPTSLGMAILVAYLMDLLLLKKAELTFPAHRFRWSPLRWNNLYLPALLVGVLLLNPLRGLLINDYRYNLDHVQVLTEKYPEMPIVIQETWFLELIYNASPAGKEQFFFILDEAAAAARGSGAFDMQLHKHMEAFRRQYPDYFGQQVVESDVFLGAHDTFLVVDHLLYDKACPAGLVVKGWDWWSDSYCPQWLERNILNNPAYEVEVLKTGFEPRLELAPKSHAPYSLLLVKKRTHE